MNDVKLMKIDGCLHLPSSPETKSYCDGWFGDEPVILVARLDAGDCYAIPSVKGDKNKRNLRSALYDAREMGLVPSDCEYVVLPGGAKFEID